MAHPKVWDGRIPCHEFPAHRIVWVEVPKAASTSLKVALANALSGGSFANDAGLHDWMGYVYASGTDQLHEWLTGRWADWFRFTVIRDPIERFASLYREKIDPAGYGSIDAWVAANADSYWWEDLHAVPQTRIIGDPADYDHVGKVERLRITARALTRHTGFPFEVGRHNATIRTAISPATRTLLARRYAADLRLF